MGTFGNEAVGGSESDDPNTIMIGSKYSVAEAGHMTNISLHVKGAVNLKVAVYSDNAGVPDDLLSESGVVAGGGAFAWVDFAMDYDFVAGTYWLAEIASGERWSHYGAGAANQQFWDTVVYPNFPDPIPAVDGRFDGALSIHADYTVGGVSKKRMLMGVGLQAKTPKFIPRKVVPWKCPLPLFP